MRWAVNERIKVCGSNWGQVTRVTRKKERMSMENDGGDGNGTSFGVRGEASKSMSKANGGNSLLGNLGFLKELMEVVDWINNGCTGAAITQAEDSSSLAVKLQDRFRIANERISELEDKLRTSQEANYVLKDKLNEMELQAEDHHCQMTTMTKELEVQKWERFDAENRLRGFVRDVGDLQAKIGELVRSLEEESTKTEAKVSTSKDCPVVKKEPRDIDEEASMGVPLGEEAEKQEEVRLLFGDLSIRVEEKLQQFERLQTESKTELLEITKGLSGLEQLIKERKDSRLSYSSASGVATFQNCSPNKKSRRSHHNNTNSLKVSKSSASAPPIPIKSILMKRSADGTFVIRRSSQDQRQDQQAPPQKQPKIASGPQKKRVQFCLDNANTVTVRTEQKENHRQSERVSHQLPPDKAKDLDRVCNHQQVAANTVEHYQVQIQGPAMDSDEGSLRFYCHCGSNFLNRKLLNRHLASKQNGKIFQCHICSKRFSLHETLKKHVQNSHKIQYHGGRFGCRDCGQTFPVYQLLRQHRSIHQSLQIISRYLIRQNIFSPHYTFK